MKKKYVFIYNANEMHIEDETPIGEFFKHNDNPVVKVNFY